jgi:hypothetical protein
MTRKEQIWAGMVEQDIVGGRCVRRLRGHTAISAKDIHIMLMIYVQTPTPEPYEG